MRGKPSTGPRAGLSGAAARAVAVAVAVGVVGAGAGLAAAPSAAEALFPHVTAYLGVFCTKDPASPVQGQVFNYAKGHYVPAAIRGFRGDLGTLRLAFTTAVVRMMGTAPAAQDNHEADDAEVARAFRGWIGRVPWHAGGVPDPRTIEAAFDRAYVRPQQLVAPGVTAQIAYDTLFRAWTADYAEKVALVLDHADILARKSRELAVRQHSPDFDGVAFQSEAARAMFPDPKSAKETVRGQDVGTLLRRNADGSLPVLVKILRRVLADYDPTTAARLGARLRYR